MWRQHSRCMPSLLCARLCVCGAVCDRTGATDVCGVMICSSTWYMPLCPVPASERLRLRFGRREHWRRYCHWESLDVFNLCRGVCTTRPRYTDTLDSPQAYARWTDSLQA
eukprot:2008364-Prymnesium_polylepis.1